MIGLRRGHHQLRPDSAIVRGVPLKMHKGRKERNSGHKIRKRGRTRPVKEEQSDILRDLNQRKHRTKPKKA